MKKNFNIFSMIEFGMILFIIFSYILPHWNKRETISFTDIIVAEAFFFLTFDIYKNTKKKFKKKNESTTKGGGI